MQKIRLTSFTDPVFLLSDADITNVAMPQAQGTEYAKCQGLEVDPEDNTAGGWWQWLIRILLLGFIWY